MSYLSSHLKLPHGGAKGLLSNALKNFSPLVGAFTGGAGGAALSGLGSALGNATSRHPSLGGALKSSLTGAGEAYLGGNALQGAKAGFAGGGGLSGGAKGAFSGLTGAFTGSPSTAGLTPEQIAAQGASTVGNGVSAYSPASAGLTAAETGGGSSLLGGLGHLVKDNAAWLGPTASGVLGARQDDAGNQLKQQQLAFEQQQYKDEQDRKRRIAELLGPLYTSLISGYQNQGQLQGTMRAPTPTPLPISSYGA